MSKITDLNDYKHEQAKQAKRKVSLFKAVQTALRHASEAQTELALLVANDPDEPDDYKVLVKKRAHHFEALRRAWARGE